MSKSLTTQDQMSVSFFSPEKFSSSLKMATLLSKSDLVPADYKGKPENILVAMEMGRELGLQPLQSLQGISVINGRPSTWGDALKGLVIANPACEWITETPVFKGEEFYGYDCISKRVGHPEHKVRFTIDDAIKAGLWNPPAKIKRKRNDGSWYEIDNPSPWFKHPKRMLQMRARAFNLRDVFPDVLKGIHMVEEAQDFPTKEVEVIQESPREKLIAEIKLTNPVPEEKFEAVTEVPEITISQEEPVKSAAAELADEITTQNSQSYSSPATENQIERLKYLIDVMNISKEDTDKWLSKAQVPKLEDLNYSQVKKCIEYLENELGKQHKNKE